MSATDILSALKVPEAVAETLLPHWQESAACLPDAVPRFLEPDSIRASRALAGLPRAHDEPLLAAARQIAASPPMRLLAWHCQRLLYEHLDYPANASMRQWPLPLAGLGALSGAFYLLIGLEAVTRMGRLHRRLGIPPEVTAATSCVHFVDWVRVYTEQHGGVGLRPLNLYWLRNYTVGDLYRLGRHEYMVRPFRGAMVAYRHRRSHAVVALVADGAGFDDDGLMPHDDDVVTWTASLEATEDTVTGVPISPRGHAERRTVTLSLSEWEPALSPGDGIVEVHIPEGGAMTPESCQASMHEALEFFPRHFPGRPFVGFACSSWILNPQLESIYRPDSNMVLWQRELYLYPTRSGVRSGLHFVFGTQDVDLATAPRDTSLRRALLDHLTTGGVLRGGGMFMLLDDFSHYGSQVYRSAAPSA